MERLFAAYREERQRLNAAPLQGMSWDELQAHLSGEGGGGVPAGGSPFGFMFGGMGAGRRGEEEDRSEYAGMYS